MQASESFVVPTQWDPFFGPPVALGKGGQGWKNDPDPRSGMAQQRAQNPIVQQQFVPPQGFQPMGAGFEQHPSYVPSPYPTGMQPQPQQPMNRGTLAQQMPPQVYSPPYQQVYSPPYQQQQAQPYQPYGGGPPVGTSQGGPVNFHGLPGHQPYAAPLPVEPRGSAGAPNVLAYPQLVGQVHRREDPDGAAQPSYPYGVPPPSASLKGNGSSGRSRKSQGEDSQSVDTELSDKGAAVEADKLL